MVTIAEAEELFAFVSTYADDEDLGDDPRLFAALSAWVYKIPSRPDLGAWNAPGFGFEAFDGRLNCPVPAPASRPSGYDGGAFHHPASDSLIIVNRGTEKSLIDWKNNFTQLLLGEAGLQQPDAVEFAVEALEHAQAAVKVRRLYLTGHSLGGALAASQFCLVERILAEAGGPKLKAVEGFTFGTAPFATSCRRFAKQRFADWDMTDFKRLRNWRRPDDPVATTDADGSDTLGVTNSKLAKVFAKVFRPDPAGTKGGKDFKVLSTTGVAHSAYLYYKYFDVGPERHIFVDAKGVHIARDGAKPR